VLLLLPLLLVMVFEGPCRCGWKLFVQAAREFPARHQSGQHSKTGIHRFIHGPEHTAAGEPCAVNTSSRSGGQVTKPKLWSASDTCQWRNVTVYIGCWIGLQASFGWCKSPSVSTADL